MTIEQLVTDEAVEQVFANTRFGIPAREVIADTLNLVSMDHVAGRTAYICCLELGLILKTEPFIYELSITGKKYLELLKEAENERH